MRKFSVPYLKLRDGRPRWEPGPHLRARGFKGQDLKSDDGDWLSEGAAIEAAKALNAAAKSPETASTEKSINAERRTVSALIALYRTRGNFASLGHRTARGYNQHLRLIEAWAGDDLVVQLSINAVEDFHKALFEARGAATANAVLRTLKLVLNFGCAKKIRWLSQNNATEIEMFDTDGRRVMWDLNEIAHMVAVMDAMGVHAQGDAFVIGAIAGQRQGDVIALREGDLRDGMYVLRTAKTNKLAKVPAIKQLIDRITAARARKKANWPNVAQPFEVVSDRSGLPYPSTDEFGKEFRILRALAAGKAQSFKTKGLSSHHRELLARGIRQSNSLPAPMPAVAAKRWQDLRDTAVTMLFLAGCSDAEIATVTGHSLETVRTILDKHYFVRVDAFTVSAGNKLETYLAANGW